MYKYLSRVKKYEGKRIFSHQLGARKWREREETDIDIIHNHTSPLHKQTVYVRRNPRGRARLSR